MSLQEAVLKSLEMRRLSPGEFLKSIGRKRHGSTIYRILSGESIDIRVSTLITICNALKVSPTEFFQLAEMWPIAERGAAPLDIRLRQDFDRIRSLAPGMKTLAVYQLEAALEALKRWEAEQKA